MSELNEQKSDDDFVIPETPDATISGIHRSLRSKGSKRITFATQVLCNEKKQKVQCDSDNQTLTNESEMAECNQQSQDLFEFDDDNGDENYEHVHLASLDNIGKIGSLLNFTHDNPEQQISMQISDEIQVESAFAVNGIAESAIDENRLPLSDNSTPDKLFGESVNFVTNRSKIDGILANLMSQEDHECQQNVPNYELPEIVVKNISVNELIQAHSTRQDQISHLIAEIQISSQIAQDALQTLLTNCRI